MRIEVATSDTLTTLKTFWNESVQKNGSRKHGSVFWLPEYPQECFVQKRYRNSNAFSLGCPEKTRLQGVLTFICCGLEFQDLEALVEGFLFLEQSSGVLYAAPALIFPATAFSITLILCIC